MTAEWRQITVAQVHGFLRGISYLNADPRACFGRAFLIDTPAGIRDLQPALHGEFSHRPDLALDAVEVLQDGKRRLQPLIMSFLLVNPHLADADEAEYLRHYLSGKIMDDLFALGPLTFGMVTDVVRCTGRLDTGTQMTFLCLMLEAHAIVIHFCGPPARAEMPYRQAAPIAAKSCPIDPPG